MKKISRISALAILTALSVIAPTLPASSAPPLPVPLVDETFTMPSWAMWESEWPKVGTKISLVPSKAVKGDLSYKWYAHLTDGSMKQVSTSREFLVPGNLSGLALSWEARYKDGDIAGATGWSSVDAGYAKPQASCKYTGVPVVGKPFKVTAISDKNAAFPQAKPYFNGLNYTDKFVGQGSTATFTPSASDAGKKPRLDITRDSIMTKNLSGESVEQISFDFSDCILPTVQTVTKDFTNAPTPTISGSLTVGKSLVANPGKWSPSGVALKYQWKRNGKAITGATKTSYKLVAADAGKKITVTTTGSKSGYKSVSKTSAAKAIPLMSLTGTPVPKVSGTAKVGSTLKASTGTWTPSSVTLKYQWKRNGKAIAGATKTSYKLVAADAGKKITVTTTGSKSGYKSVSKTSAAKTVALMSLTRTPVPTVSGTAKVGFTLKASAGTWAPSGVTLKYQWKRDGKAIAGATKTSYKLVAADAGKKITVTTTGSKSGYKSVSKTSAAKAIPLMSLTGTPVPKVSGTAKVGSTLKASAGTWAPSGVTLKYQWKRDGKAIAGATKTSYKLSKSDKSRKVSVTTTGSKSGYKSVSKTSLAKLIK